MIRNNGYMTAVAALSMLSTVATAESPQRSGDEPIDTVTVEAERLRMERQISHFVTELALHSRNDSLARWQLPICPLVAGLSFEQGKFVFQRVSQIASEAGIPLAPIECKPNLLVVMTREPEELLKRWWSNQPRLFNTERGVAGIKRKIRTPAPVRVFYNACSVPPGTFGPHVLGSCNTGTAGSHLTWGAIRAIYSVVVVVDKRKTEDVTLGPLTDYIAMLSLVHVRKDPDLGAAPTILRLFQQTDAARPEGLSAWDRSFLESLYTTDSANVTQVSQIKHRMKQRLVR